MDHDPVDANLGISRRTLLRRGAIVGGTLVWAAPAVQTIARPAFGQATGSPCTVEVRITVTSGGGSACLLTTFETDPACCDCLIAGGLDVMALANCLVSGACSTLSVVESVPCP